MVLFARNLGLALLLLLSAPPSRAGAACPGPQRGALALRLLHGVPLVTATIDGTATPLILDTGAAETVLTAAAAARLGLQGHYEYPRRLRGVSGGLATGEARLKSLALGGVGLPDFIVLVGALALPDAAGAPPAGLLGGDFLSRFDLALDLAQQRLDLYPAGCAPARPPWPGGYTAIAANRSIDDRLFFPVLLDGHKLFAFIDTGAQISAIDREAARRLGLSRAALAGDPAAAMRGVSVQPVQVRAHRFAQLRIGEATVRDPVLAVADLNLPDADIVLGVDFLRGRRVWFDYPARRIFLGPAR